MSESSHSTAHDASERHVFTRVRHELQRRWLTVTQRQPIGGDLIRLTLSGPDLKGFSSPGFDDHIKLFFPVPGENIREAALESLTGRHYTPRRHDPEAGELDIEFYLHETGIATQWAANAQVGDEIMIGGPRGSLVPPEDFDWYVLIGDETALPAIARRLEQLTSRQQAIVIGEVARPGCEIALNSAANLKLQWVYRDLSSPSLVDATSALTLPSGEGYAWIACEGGLARELRKVFVEQHDLPKDWIKAAGYWKQGESDQHLKIEE